MTNHSEEPGGAAEYYETRDVSQELEAGTWERHERKQAATAMSGFNTRLPAAVLNDAQALARARGMTTSAWIREVIEAAVSTMPGGLVVDLRGTGREEVATTHAMLGLLAEDPIGRSRPWC